MSDVMSDISAEEWAKGIALSILASIVGGASKLAIRKSWCMVEEDDDRSLPSMEDTSSQGTLPENMTLDTTSSVISDEENIGGRTRSRDSVTEEQYRRNCTVLCLRYFGMVGMSILNPICCVLAMKYASPSILAPFSGLTLVWVILFSHMVVGERPSLAQKIASSLIIIGEVVVAAFGDHTNDMNVTVDGVIQSYKNPYFLAYFGALSAYVILLSYWMRNSQNSVLRRFAWGSCGGAITGLQNFLKDSLTLYQVADKFSWFFPFFMILAGASAFSGLLMLTACMKRYDATYSAASFVGSFVVSASIMSATHYNTFRDLAGTLNVVLYVVGLGVLMLGVIILVRESEDSNEGTSDGEQAIPVRKNTDDSQVPFMYAKVEDDSDDSHVQNNAVV